MTTLASLSLSGTSGRPALRSLLAALGVLGAVACGGITEGEAPDGRGDQVACGIDGCGDGTPPEDRTVDGPAAPETTPTPPATATATAPAEPPPPAPVALAQAMTRAQYDALTDAYWEQHGEGMGTGGGPVPDLDPSDLFLQLSDQGVVCSSPFVTLPCGGHWSATLVLPPALQQVGVYSLTSSEIGQFSSLSDTGMPYSDSPGDCAHGMGGFLGGTLEIVSIDATHVHFKVQADTFFDADPSGEYTALRCPQ